MTAVSPPYSLISSLLEDGDLASNRLKTLISNLEDERGYDQGVPYDDIVDEMEENGVKEAKVAEEIERLRRDGTVYEPATDKYRVVSE